VVSKEKLWLHRTDFQNVSGNQRGDQRCKEHLCKRTKTWKKKDKKLGDKGGEAKHQKKILPRNRVPRMNRRGGPNLKDNGTTCKGKQKLIQGGG